jgi:hypothetical protein
MRKHAAGGADRVECVGRALTDRLNRLVDEGVLERVPYSGPSASSTASPTRAKRRSPIAPGDLELLPGPGAQSTAQITEGNRTLNGHS